MLELIDEIMYSDGEILNLDDANNKLCRNFDGKESCCSTEIVNNLPFLIRSYVRR